MHGRELSRLGLPDSLRRCQEGRSRANGVVQNEVSLLLRRNKFAEKCLSVRAYSTSPDRACVSWRGRGVLTASFKCLVVCHGEWNNSSAKSDFHAASTAHHDVDRILPLVIPGPSAIAALLAVLRVYYKDYIRISQGVEADSQCPKVHLTKFEAS